MQVTTELIANFNIRLTIAEVECLSKFFDKKYLPFRELDIFYPEDFKKLQKINLLECSTTGTILVTKLKNIKSNFQTIFLNIYLIHDTTQINELKFIETFFKLFLELG